MAEKEKKVYLLELIDDLPDDLLMNVITDPNLKSIIDYCEEQGSVYSLDGFQHAFNNNEINLDNSYIFIK